MNKITKNDPQAQTQDIVNENISKLKELFPEVFSEGKIDFETLESLLGEYVEKDDERYNFTWKGKAEARRMAQTPSTATLRPAKEESKNWDTTKNLYIEGDNLEVLKLLQKSYHKKVKMIYIDPPYNTGKDFVYKDNYKDNLKNYMELTGQVDEEGNKISTNSDSSGRYHSNWLNMMYPRLKLARNLLKDDGVIFISIDDNEVHNLRKICDEVFGDENFIEQFIWIKRTAPNNVVIGSVHEYILAYSKSKESLALNLLPRDKQTDRKYSNPDNDARGPWMPDNITSPAKGGRMTQSLYYELENPITGTKHLPPKGRMWSVTKEDMLKKIKENSLYWGKDGNGRPMNKRFLSETRDGMTVSTLLDKVGSNNTASKGLGRIFDGEVIFETPKPVSLIKLLTTTGANKDDLILDFYAGSSTTAHAVMQLNAEDASTGSAQVGKRKFIMVQLPEPTDEKSEAYKAGYKNICEIGKERIRRAGEKIIKDYELEIINDEKKSKGQQNLLKGNDIHNSSSIIHNLDVGFKVFKLDSSNIKTWDATAENIEQKLLDSVHNIKSERSEDDVLFEVLLKYGLDLTLPIEVIEINGKKIYSVGYGSLVVCLDDEIDMEIAKAIVSIKDDKKPETMNVIFKDTGFKDDVAKTNVVQYLEKYEIDSIRSI